MNDDFVEMLCALSEAGAEYLLVEAYALATYGIPRATGDIGIWVRSSAENAARVRSALGAFGAPLFDLSAEDLARPGVVFQIGVAPGRIDILTSISGVTFEEAWPRRSSVVLPGITVPVIGRADFIVNKRATGRPKDLADLALLGTEG